MELIVVYKQGSDTLYSIVDAILKFNDDDYIYPIVTSFKQCNLFVFEYNSQITYTFIGNKSVFLEEWFGDLRKNNDIVDKSNYKIVMIEQEQTI